MLLIYIYPNYKVNIIIIN